MKHEIISSIKISSTFIGTLIGAGFASGQEVMVYFGAYGRFGAIGIFLYAVTLFFLIISMSLLIRRGGTRNFPELLSSICGRFGARFFMIIFIAFVFITFGVMVSGFGASIEQHLGFNKYISELLFLLAMTFVLRSGERGVIFLNMALAPIMIFSIIGISVYLLLRGGLPVLAASPAPAIASSILYSGYNGITGVALIAQLPHMIKSRTTGIISAFIISISLAGILLPMYLLIRNSFAFFSIHQIPLLYAATNIHPAIGHLYFLVLLMAMTTTAAGCGFSLCGSLGISMQRGAILLPLCSIPFMFFEFSLLVSKLYSFFGFFGTALLFIIIFRAALSLLSKRRPRKTD